MAVELDLWLGGKLVGRTVSTERGRKVRVLYDDAIVAELGGEIPLLSCSLPTPGPSTPSHARAFLEGLLPEGRALESAAAQVRGVALRDGAPETPSDAVLLLAEYGRECAGAVVVVPSGEPGPSLGRYHAIDENALAGLLRGLPEHPLGSDLGREIRMSLAGAQPKLLLARIDDRWHEPLEGAASTHILKPTAAWPDSARNEAMIMTLARMVGLTDRLVWVEDIQGTPVLVAERYDREVQNGTVGRLHQEDMCQAVGLRPSEKYYIGRPSERMARLIRQFTDSPRVELERLFCQIAFRVIVGDEDGHGKNYSVLLNGGVVSLAPMYDSLCTLVYPELNGKMGTQIGKQVNLMKVDRAALLDEAKAMGIPDSDAQAKLDELSEMVRTAIDAIDPSLTQGWPSDRVAEIVMSRLERLDSGLPLGTSNGSEVAGSHTLDEETLRR